MSTSATGPVGPVDPVTGERPPQPPPPRPRPRRTSRDVVLSMLVVGAFLVPILLWLPRPSAVEQPPVDVVGTAVGARDRADFAIAVPEVPEGWTPNAARLEQPGADDLVTWSVGWVTPAENYAGLRVAAGATGRWLDETVSGGNLEGVQDVEGQEWDSYRREPNRRSDPPFRALVREDGDVTTAVIGTADLPELVELAAAAQEPSAVEPPG